MMRVSFGSPDLTCSLCIEPYDLQKHKPMVLCLNMHTICIDCAVKTKAKLCPFCKRKYEVKDLVPNRYVIQQIKTKFPDMRIVEPSSQNGISNNLSQRIVPQNNNFNEFNGGYFNNNIGNGNNIVHQVNPYQVRPVVQNNVPRQINYSENLSADNAILRGNRNNNPSSNNSNRLNDRPNNIANQGAIRPHLNQVGPQPNNANNGRNCCIIVAIILVICLAVYFVTQGQDYYGGAAACGISAICGCISILCKTDERNQRDVYVYQPNRQRIL